MAVFYIVGTVPLVKWAASSEQPLLYSPVQDETVLAAGPTSVVHTANATVCFERVSLPVVIEATTSAPIP
jgi:hypothetical protein